VAPLALQGHAAKQVQPGLKAMLVLQGRLGQLAWAVLQALQVHKELSVLQVQLGHEVKQGLQVLKATLALLALLVLPALQVQRVFKA
jgi:hypothetical protein